MATGTPSLSNFPGGFSGGVTIRGIPLVQTHAGKVFYVGNGSVVNPGSVGGSDGNPGTFQKPFATLDYAIGKCVADQGDIIFILPGHAETVSAASGITVDIAGITIKGLGTGAKRPIFTFSATASTIVVSAANVTIENIITTPSIDSVVSPIVVSGADCYLDFEHQDASATVEAVRAVLTTAAADRFKCKLKYVGFVAGNAVVNAVRLVGADGAKIEVDFYGVASTAVVEFLTTACTNVEIEGWFHNSGTALTKNVVDTATSSLWSARGWDNIGGYTFSGGSAAALAADDIATATANTVTILADLAVPTADVTTNTLERDVVGNKTDAGVTAVGTTKTVMAYSKGLVTMNTVQAADSTNNAFAGDVVGNKTDAAVYVAGTTKSILAYAKGQTVLQEKLVVSTTAALVNAATIFTVTGDIEIISLVSECVTTGDGAAATVQWQANPTVGAAATFTGATGSLATAVAGSLLIVDGTALSTAPTLNVTGAGLSQVRPITIAGGAIKTVVGGAASTATWKHYLRYRPLEVAAAVV